MKLNLGSLVLVVVAAVVGLVARSRWGPPLTPWQIAGLAIALPAFVLFAMARVQLGSAFSVQAKASKLVTTGIYARIRNPIYVFGGLLIIGVMLYLGRPWWLLLFLVLIPIQRIRIRKEEQVLEAKFGDAYRQYKQQTWF